MYERKEMKFPMVLKLLRESKGLTMRSLASSCDFSPAYISDLEKGNRKVTLQVIDRICECLDLSEKDKEILLKAYTYDRLNVSPDLMRYIIDNDLIDYLNVIKDNDKEGNSIKELANKLKYTKGKR